MKTVAEIKALHNSSASIDEFLKALTELPFSDDRNETDNRLAALARTVLDRKNEVRSIAAYVQKTVSGVLKHLDNKGLSYSGISSSGELQSSGPRFDVACARYYDAFEQFNAELASRRYAEETVARAQCLKNLSGTPFLIVEQLRRDGDTTAAKLVRDITKGTDFTETDVRTALTLLVQFGMVTAVGQKHYRFDPYFPVTGTDKREAEVQS